MVSKLKPCAEPCSETGGMKGVSELCFSTEKVFMFSHLPTRHVKFCKLMRFLGGEVDAPADESEQLQDEEMPEMIGDVDSEAGEEGEEEAETADPVISTDQAAASDEVPDVS